MGKKDFFLILSVFVGCGFLLSPPLFSGEINTCPLPRFQQVPILQTCFPDVASEPLFKAIQRVRSRRLMAVGGRSSQKRQDHLATGGIKGQRRRRNLALPQVVVSRTPELGSPLLIRGAVAPHAIRHGGAQKAGAGALVFRLDLPLISPESSVAGANQKPGVEGAAAGHPSASLAGSGFHSHRYPCRGAGPRRCRLQGG